MDALTFALALVGAVTGTVSATVQGVAAWRDRSRLKLFLENIENERGQFVQIGVLNDSPRPTTVREVGLWHRKTRMKHLASDGMTVLGEFEGVQNWRFLDRPTFFEAGETKQFVLPVTQIDAPHVDSPLRCFAVDARGRYVWGTAAAVLRYAFGSDIPVKPDAPEHVMRFLAARDETELPDQVEPRWKVWKKRELRNPKAWKNPLVEPDGYGRSEKRPSG